MGMEERMRPASTVLQFRNIVESCRFDRNVAVIVRNLAQLPAPPLLLSGGPRGGAQAGGGPTSPVALDGEHPDARPGGCPRRAAVRAPGAAAGPHRDRAARLPLRRRDLRAGAGDGRRGPRPPERPAPPAPGGGGPR